MEIGSEFWKNSKKLKKDNEQFFLTGRTALDAIIEDITYDNEILSVLLPGYCCESMIIPFVRHGIKVRFYEIFEYNGHLYADVPKPQVKEIFFAITYFGNSNLTFINPLYEKWEEIWEFTIEDRTHSFFHKNKIMRAKYEFCSLRKWMAIDGLAIARKKDGYFKINFNSYKTFDEYCKIRNSAFALKNNYINGEKLDKNIYLDLFSEAENMIDETYESFRPDINSIIEFYIGMQNLDEMRCVRQENAEFLLKELNDIVEVDALLDMDEGICPLCVPIVISEKRDEFRRYLINREIYCPVHWPMSKWHVGVTERTSNLYNREISLICDQRYSKNDMQREINAIKNYFS